MELSAYQAEKESLAKKQEYEIIEALKVERAERQALIDRHKLEWKSVEQKAPPEQLPMHERQEKERKIKENILQARMEQIRDEQREQMKLLNKKYNIQEMGRDHER